MLTQCGKFTDLKEQPAVPAPKHITAENVARAELICQSALATEHGVTIRFSSQAKALHYRQSIYAARRVCRKVSPESESLLEKIEIVLKNSGDTWDVVVRKQGYALRDLEIINNDTGERIHPENDKLTQESYSEQLPLYKNAVGENVPNEELLLLEMHFNEKGFRGDELTEKATEAYRLGWRIDRGSKEMVNFYKL